MPKESRDAAPCRLVQEITKKDSAESQPFRLPLCQKGATDLRVLVDCLQYEKMLRLCPWIHLFVGQVCQSRCRFVGLAGTAWGRGPASARGAHREYPKSSFDARVSLNTNLQVRLTLPPPRRRPKVDCPRQKRSRIVVEPTLWRCLDEHTSSEAP